MATTMRSVDTRFWVDVWVRKLNALDRYIFLYFLTNTHSSWCGVYEVDLGMVAFETGIEEQELINAILPRLSPKVIYVDGWVVIKNFEKYHSNKSKDTQEGIKNAWKAVPENIRLKISKVDSDIDPLGGVSPSASASASASALFCDSTESPLKDNEKDMGWKNRQSDNDDDLPSIGDDGEEIETEEDKLNRETKELNVKIRANLKTIEPLRGTSWGVGKDMNFHVKIYRELMHSGWSHKGIISAFIEIADTPHWKEKKKQGESPGMNTVQFHLRNKKPV